MGHYYTTVNADRKDAKFGEKMDIMISKKQDKRERRKWRKRFDVGVTSVEVAKWELRWNKRKMEHTFPRQLCLIKTFV